MPFIQSLDVLGLIIFKSTQDWTGYLFDYWVLIDLFSIVVSVKRFYTTQKYILPKTLEADKVWKETPSSAGQTERAIA